MCALAFLLSSRRLCFCQFLFVCLSVCLSVSKMTQKVMDGFFSEILRVCRAWHKLQVIKF